jgi:putative redox protein
MAADEIGGVAAETTSAGKFQVAVSVRDLAFVADEPADVGGLGSGPTPYELLCAGLGACTAMTTRLYAAQKGWPLQRVRVVVTHEKIAGQTPTDVFHRRIAFEGPLDASQIARLFQVAERCPVHRTLEAGAKVETAPLAADPPPSPAATEAAAEEHFHDMEHACRD